MQPSNRKNKIRTREHGEWKEKEIHENRGKKSSSRIAMITTKLQDGS